MENTNQSCVWDQGRVSVWGHFKHLAMCSFFRRLLPPNPVKMVDQWLHRKHQRQRLMDLPDYLLDDIGLTRNQVRREYNRPFWDKGIY